MQLAGQVAAPAWVRADYDAGELAQLRLPPVEIHMQGHLTERSRAAKAGLNADDSGFLLVQAYVGAGGLGAQANTPLAGVLLPEREIGVDQRKRKLFYPVLEVNSRIGGFKIRQSRRTARTGCRLCLFCGSPKKGIEIPLAGPGAYNVKAGFIHADLPNLDAAAQKFEQADGSNHCAGVKHRLGAISGILGDA